MDLTKLDLDRSPDDIRAGRFPELEAEQQRRMRAIDEARAAAIEVQREYDRRMLGAKLDQLNEAERAQIIAAVGGIPSEEAVGTPGG